MNKQKLIIFDFDGVLINSEKNMEITWNKTIKYFKDYDIPFSEYKKNIGLPFKNILKKLNIQKKHFKIITSNYKKNSLYYQNKIKLFKGIKPLIKKLKKNYKIALFTSKDNLRTKFLIRKFNLEFDTVIAGNDVKKGKPHPEGLKKILSRLNFKKKKFIFYIGDTIHDYNCAKNLKIKYVHVKCGFEKIKKNKDIKFVKDLNELDKFLP